MSETKLTLASIKNEPFFSYVEKQVKNGAKIESLVTTSKSTGRKILKGEEGLVILEITDASAWKKPKKGESVNYLKRVQKFNSTAFMDVFKMHFLKNDLFENVTTPALIYRIISNITLEIFKEAVDAPANLSRKEKTTWYADEFDAFKKMQVNGGSDQFVSEWVHIPTIEDDASMGLDMKLAKEFPADCII